MPKDLNTDFRVLDMLKNFKGIPLKYNNYLFYVYLDSVGEIKIYLN